MEKFSEILKIHKPNIQQTGDILNRYAKIVWIPVLAYAISVGMAYMMVKEPHDCACGNALSEAARVGVFLGALCALYAMTAA